MTKLNTKTRVGIYVFLLVLLLLLVIGLMMDWSSDDNNVKKDINDSKQIIKNESKTEFESDFNLDTVSDILNLDKTLYHNITRANDTRIITIIEGYYAPVKLYISCIYKVVNKNITHIRYLPTDDNGFYSIIFNRDTCKAGDIIQVCTEDNICSDKVEVSLAKFSMEYYNHTIGKRSRSIRSSIIAVPEYSLISAMFLMCFTVGAIVFLRKK